MRSVSIDHPYVFFHSARNTDVIPVNISTNIFVFISH